MLTLDEASHTYTWDSKPVPSVTQILGASGLVDYSMIPPAALEKARQEGKATHRLVELDCAGTLDVAGLPEWMKPVYKAWREFKDTSGFVPILSEHQGYNNKLHYAGTLDLLCNLPYLKGWEGNILIDVKRSLYAGPVIGLQLSAYEMILASDKAMPKVDRRGALRLNKDGKFRIEPYDDRSDAAMFLSLLNIQRWREKHAIN